MARALGTDDSVTNCDCCGKSGLKFTVAIELDCGDIVHYGSTCASRNTGKSRRVLNAEMKANAESKIAAARSEWFIHPAYLAERARIAARPRGMLGREAIEFVRDATQAADSARHAIADKHGVRFFDLM